MRGIWFVYRSHEEGPLGRRVRRLRAGSILEWFKERIDEARTSKEPRGVGEEELGGYVYGLGTIFEAVKEEGLRAPRSTAALEKMLREHLYVEGGDDHLRIDDHTLRVLTDDDEVDLAYFFFDDVAADRYPDRIAYLLEDDPELSDGDEDGPFEPPFEVAELLPRGGGEGTTYAALFTFYDGGSMPGTVAAFPGVRLPGLSAHLRGVIPASTQASWSADGVDTWPVEMRLLRAMVEDGDRALAPALGRCAAYPLGPVALERDHAALGIEEHEAARGDFMEAALGLEHGGEPARSIVHEGEHVAVLCAHTSAHFGYQQWILFDDRWAGAYPDLAASILRYGRTWDPFPSPEELAAERRERAWEAAIAARPASDARAFQLRERYAVGELIDHPKFGLGLVQRSLEATKIEVLFRDACRTLAHGIQPTQPR